MVTASLFYPALHHFKSSLQIMIILCYVRCVLWFHRSRAEQESENASKGQKYTKTNKQNTPKYRIIKLSCETRLNIICAINLVSVPALIKKLPLEGEIRTVKQSMKLSINPSLVMMRECPCSTKTREVLGNPSPPPSRFPSTLEISLGLRPREISRVSGNLSGVGDGFPNTSLVLVEHGYITPFMSLSHGCQQWFHYTVVINSSYCRSFNRILPQLLLWSILEIYIYI